MERIFISYKRLDKEKVFKIKDEIEKKLNVTCWIDLDGIESDAQFVGKIRRAIDACDVFLFMHSRRHTEITDFKNDWTIRELNYAQSENKRIVVINIDSSPLTKDLKLLFGTQQQIDYNNEDLRSRLFIDLGRWLEANTGSRHIEQNMPHHITSSSRSGTGKGTKLMIAGLVVAAIVLGGFYLTKQKRQSAPLETEITIPSNSEAAEYEVPDSTKGDNEAMHYSTEDNAEASKSLSAAEFQALGDKYYREQNYPKAVDYYFQAADLGNVAAQVALGHCYLTGTGIEPDYSEAVVWFTKAANQCNADAQYALGLCYALGNGVNEDYAKAAEWFRKAADQGHEKAREYLEELNGLLSN